MITITKSPEKRVLTYGASRWLTGNYQYQSYKQVRLHVNLFTVLERNRPKGWPEDLASLRVFRVQARQAENAGPVEQQAHHQQALEGALLAGHRMDVGSWLWPG